MSDRSSGTFLNQGYYTSAKLYSLDLLILRKLANSCQTQWFWTTTTLPSLKSPLPLDGINAKIFENLPLECSFTCALIIFFLVSQTHFKILVRQLNRTNNQTQIIERKKFTNTKLSVPFFINVKIFLFFCLLFFCTFRSSLKLRLLRVFCGNICQILGARRLSQENTCPSPFNYSSFLQGAKSSFIGTSFQSNK